MFSWHETIQYSSQIQRSYRGRRWTFSICVIELQNSLKGRVFNFLLLILYHHQMTWDIACCSFFHGPFGLSFHYFSSLLLVMQALPSQSARSVVLAVSSCREGGFGPSAPQLDQNESAKQISEATRKQPNICHPCNCCAFIAGIVRFRFNEAVRHLCRNINKSKVCCWLLSNRWIEHWECNHESCHNNLECISHSLRVRTRCDLTRLINDVGQGVSLPVSFFFYVCLLATFRMN